MQSFWKLYVIYVIPGHNFLLYAEITPFIWVEGSYFF